MTRYEVVYEENDDPDVGVYGISVVDNPANRMEAIALSETEEHLVTLKANDNIQQTLTGVVLIPNQVITRLDNTTKQKYEITFPQQSIINLSRDYMRKGYQNKGTFNHDDSKWLEGITVVESWLTSHESLDKAFALGFKDLPVGTWMVTMKLSDELWKKYVETGLVTGFSIDSYIPFRKIEMSLDTSVFSPQEIVVIPTKLNINNLKTKTMNLISGFMQLMKQHSISLASIDVEGVTYFADAFELDYIVSYEQDGQMVPCVDMTFEYDGFVFTTDGEGKIVSKEAVAPEAPMEEEVEEEVMMEDLPAEIVGEVMVTTEHIETEVLKPIEEIDTEALTARIAELEAQLETIMAEKQAVLDENATLMSQPSSTRLKAVVESNRAKETTLSALSRIANQKQ